MACSLFVNLPRPPHLSSQQKPPSKDPSAWDSLLKHHAKLKNDHAILSTYNQMEASGVARSRATLPLVLKACARLQDIEVGKRIHSDISGTQLVGDVRIRTALVGFYSKCGLLDDARQLFEEMTERDLVLWNAMISGYVGSRHYEDAIGLFHRMSKEGLEPSSVTLVSLLSACTELNEFRLGQEVHCYCLRCGLFELEPHIGTSLIRFYSRFDLRSSHSVFESMVRRNTVSWNAIIYEYFHKGHISEALKLFVRMLLDNVALDSVTLLAILQSCAELEYMELGQQVHQIAIKYGFASDNFGENALIDMYGRCGNSESSCVVFEKMQTRDLASWNALISAYRNCMCYDKAIDLFKRMELNSVGENAITIATVLSVCAESGDLEKGKQLHAYAIKTGKASDVPVKAALLTMYVDFDCIESALEVFHRMDKLNAISWNTLITGLIRNQSRKEGWSLFSHMLQTETKPNSYTMVSLLGGCNEKSYLNIGRSSHGYILRHGLNFNSLLCTALTDMYMDCGCEPTALHIFWSYPGRDLVSWNALIASYIRNGRPNKALSLFYEMLSEEKPNSATMINILPSCAQTANLPEGRCLHAYIVRREIGLPFDISLGNALLTMYAKCGSIRNAEKIFQNLLRRDIISWNAMIAAYGMHGHGEDALRIFSQMVDAGEKPTSVTFVSILSACSHAGLVLKGCELFNSMVKDYDVETEVVHYACVVDLLSRSGSLAKASDMILSMPMEPGADVWRALLSACREFPNTELARKVAGKLIELEPMNIGNYILLSNIYAAVGNWEDVKILRAHIKEMGLKKTAGNSWMVIRNQVHSFTAGDKSHSQSHLINTNPKLLLDRQTKNGSKSDLS